MVSALISRALLLTAGTLYPAYRSYKGIKTKNVREYVKWMMYWIVFAVYLCLEALADIFIAFWCPLYYELKILFIIWLLSPYTKGASLLYRKFLHPFLLNHEQEIDVCLEKFKRKSYTRMVDLRDKGLTYAKEMVAFAALRSHEHIVGQMRKTVSLDDMTDSRPHLQLAVQYSSTSTTLGDRSGNMDDDLTPDLPPINNRIGAGRRGTKPPRVRPGLNHVIKRTTKAEAIIEQGVECSDNGSDFPDEEPAYVIGQEFSYLEEQNEMESNKQVDENLDVDDEVMETSNVDASPNRRGKEREVYQDDGKLRQNAGQRRPRNASEAIRGQGIEKRYGRINYPKFPSSSSSQSSDCRNLSLFNPRRAVTLQDKGAVLQLNTLHSSIGLNHESDFTLRPDSTMNEVDSRPDSSVDSGHGTTTERTNLIDLNQQIVRRIRQNCALLSPESVSCEASPRGARMNFDVYSFELLEHLAENTSLSSDSSLIHKIEKLGAYDVICRSQNYDVEEPFERHLLSTVQEVTNENTQQDNPEKLRNSDSILPSKRKEVEEYLSKDGFKVQNIEDHDQVTTSGSLKSESVKSNSVTNTSTGHVRDFSQFSLQLPATMRDFVMGQFPCVLPPQLKPKPGPLQSVENRQNDVHLNSQTFQSSTEYNENDVKKRQERIRKLKMLERRLRAMMELMSKDADRLADMRCKVEERANENEKESDKLKQDRLDFENRMEKELASLKNGYKDLERERHAFVKEQNLAKRKEDEMISILKMEVIQRIKSDGSKEIIYSSGTVEEVKPDGSLLYTYTNGDTRRIDTDCVETYHFASSNITQSRDLNGFVQIFYGSDNRHEKHYVDGRVEILTSDRIKRTLSPDGSETVEYPDRTVSQRLVGGEEVLTFTDGSKEIRTREYTKREFPNSDVKFRYKDGSEETRLASGRIRIRDAEGRIVRDEMIQFNKE